MSETTTQVEHLQMRLAATALELEAPLAITIASASAPATATATATATGGLVPSRAREERPNVVAIARRPSDISLAVTIKVIRGESPVATTVPTITTTTPASKHGVWSELRATVVAASYEAAGVDNFANLTFKLEEDGHAACMTIAPTRIDAQTAFPSKTYEAWYHRILRGKQSSYVVDVTIDAPISTSISIPHGPPEWRFKCEGGREPLK
ncbi:hypothetical protein PV04_04349 [Phialophora macrospora]|uniref:Uncharacterized protein n=1 Tax=Phialophora macrospora TaxID=1851006 RepID=A0A0D2FJV1_9EURO|nr:hypothetical protein PV04_04349 [Phialophora macrospora]